MKTCKRDEVIFRQNDFADSMYDILSGSVGIYVAYGTEDENRLAVLKAGHTLGEMGLIDLAPRSATAVALEDGTVLAEISEKEFAAYFDDKPERLLEIMRQLSTRVRNQTKDYEAARRILDSMLTTRPEKRSPTLKKEVKRLLDSYNETMNLVNKYAGSSMFYPFSPDQF
jgi:CRP-like cAMP-binding protein